MPRIDRPFTMAFPDGRGHESAYSSFECGAIVGTGWGGLDSANDNNNDYRQTRYATSYSTVMSMNNAATAALAIHYQMRGSVATEGAALGWWLFRSRLRQPVVAGDTVLLATRPQGRGIAFSVSSATQERRLLTGALVSQGPPCGDDTPWLRLDLPADKIAARAEELVTAFPWLNEPWVIIDALLFSEFLRTGMKDLLDAHGVDLVAGVSAGGEFVVQTSHDVAIDRDFFARPLPLDAGLTVEASPPEVEAVEAGVYATCPLVARYRGRAVMRMSMGIAIMKGKYVIT